VPNLEQPLYTDKSWIEEYILDSFKPPRVPRTWDPDGFELTSSSFVPPASSERIVLSTAIW
jgi:hypothetical protein